MSLTSAVAETLRNALATVVVVPVTPLHADGNSDWDAYATLTRRLIGGGITVITPNGNTGEFYALSQVEARQVLETAARASNGQAELLAGVGHDIATAVEAAGHAGDHGARMIMIHQPVHPGAAELTAPLTGHAARTGSPRAWPTSARPCRSPCSTPCGPTTSDRR